MKAEKRTLESSRPAGCSQFFDNAMRHERFVSLGERKFGLSGIQGAGTHFLD
jgi:hypothetical protein